MKLQINYKHLAAEFVIVVVGVAVALAADGWRQELLDRNLENEYVERLIFELEITRSRLVQEREFLAEAHEGARRLLEKFESSEHLDSDDAIMDFAYAARTGGYTNGTTNRLVAYDELVSTGRLQLIRQTNIRNSLANYSSVADGLRRERETIPPTIWRSFRELTGSSPRFFIDDAQPMTELQKSRLRRSIVESEISENELRFLASRLQLLDRQLRVTLFANEELTAELSEY